MNHSTIVVIGSTNTDMVIRAPHLPLPGETLLGSNFFMNPGGKGANQAVAAKRLGGNVIFIAKTGNDVFGETALKQFRMEGIITDYMSRDVQNPSGVALITLDENAENTIVVAPGANSKLLPEDILPAETQINREAVVLIQLEIPLETVKFAASLAAMGGSMLILNPAPACILPDELLKLVSVITPNETEAEMLSGQVITDLDGVRSAALAIRARGVKTVIITLGSKGAWISNADIELLVEAPIVEAIDTTAAGDVFNGALAVALSEGRPLEDAVAFSCRAAAISVTRLGAQAAAPYRNEIKNKPLKPS